MSEVVLLAFRQKLNLRKNYIFFRLLLCKVEATISPMCILRLFLSTKIVFFSSIAKLVAKQFVLVKLFLCLCLLAA